MAKNQANKKVSAIDAIIHPFQFESYSTQTHSPVKDLRLGGKTITVQRYNHRKGEWESVSEAVGGEVLKVSHRVRTGKTRRERERAMKAQKVEAPAAAPVKGKRK
ncbi:hypothetical protein KASHIRA_00930 [Serratia phage vB_SmaM-Kashira]|nr:hypothetical protein [Acinetobacter phage ABPH49]URC22672.1 hypothetical protein KASHIRA_00930 [Serratia phage vB_SmaM-Kashira]